MKHNEVTAVIVARKGSKRIANKNLLLLNNQTLVARKIYQLKQCKNIDRVVCGSDSDEILAEAHQAGAETIRRPDFFCDESVASANDMIANMMDLIKSDIIVWAHCTNPLLSPTTYDNAVNTFIQNIGIYDSLLSVIELKEHLWGTNKQPLNYNPYAPKHTPARDLPPYYQQDGGIFIQPYQQMKENHYFFGKKPYLFTIPNDEFCDINEERDYLLAKSIIEKCSK